MNEDLLDFWLISLCIQISDEKVRDAADQITKRVTDSILELRRLFLVGDFIDTLKVPMHSGCTYLTASFPTLNGVCICYANQ